MITRALIRGILVLQSVGPLVLLPARSAQADGGGGGDKADEHAPTGQVTANQPSDGAASTATGSATPSDVTAPTSPTPPSRWVPGVLLGVGIAGVVGGVVLFAIDEDPSPSGGKKYWDTAPAGIVVGVAGLVTAGVGAYLWLRGSYSNSSPTAAVVHGGGAVGWSWSF